MKKLLMVLVVMSLVACGKGPQNASVPTPITPVQTCDLVRDKAGKAVISIDVSTTLNYTFSIDSVKVTDSGSVRVVGTENLELPACTVEVVAGKVSQVVYK